MHRELSELIAQNVDVAQELFPRVAAHAGVNLPISNMDWAALQIEQRGETPDGVRYFKHGYGLNMTDGARFIDLDFGSRGEIDGFDALRLWIFAEKNNISILCADGKALHSAIESAARAGKLRFSGDILYYRANGT